MLIFGNLQLARGEITSGYCLTEIGTTLVPCKVVSTEYF